MGQGLRSYTKMSANLLFSSWNQWMRDNGRCRRDEESGLSMDILIRVFHELTNRRDWATGTICHRGQFIIIERRPHCRSCLHHHYKSLEYDGIVCCPILVSVTESITSSPPVKQFISYVSSNNSHVVLEWNCVGRSVLLHECVPLDILGILSHANRSFRLFQILLRVLDILLLLPCPIARPTHKCNCAYILVRHHPTNQSTDGPHKRITIGYVGGGFACPWQVWILARKGHGQGSMTGS